MAPGRQISSFECSVCNNTMETWNTAWVPTYRLVAGPSVPADFDTDTLFDADLAARWKAMNDFGIGPRDFFWIERVADDALEATA